MNRLFKVCISQKLPGLKQILALSYSRALVLFSCILVLNNATAQTGTVVDNATNAPLQNALVSLKSTGALTLTDKDGKFAFSTAALPMEKKALLSHSISFSHGTVTFRIDNHTTPVTIQLYSANGRKVADVVNRTLDAGSYTLPLSLPSSQLYLASVKIGAVISTHRLLACSYPHVSSRALAPTSSPNRTLARSCARALVTSSSDTLIVSKYLYTPVTQPLTPNATTKLTKPATAPPPPGMKSIPGGTFMMGATPNSRYEQNELPPHEVTLSPFYMDSTEVTQADYVLLMGIAPWSEYVVANSSEKYPGKGNNLPAWYLTWDDAVLYCNARSKRDGLDTVYSYSGLKSGVYGSNSVLTEVKIDYAKKGYHLPTEAEWEYAARAGTYMDYYWANKEDSTAPKYARYMSEGPLPVASLLPNAFGLYDMVGNTSEFVNDYDGAYPNQSTIDPIGPVTGTERIKRGGGWADRITNACRIARRLGASPRHIDLPQGLRVCLSNK